MRAFLEVIPRGGSRADGKDSKKRKLPEKKVESWNAVKCSNPRQMFLDLGQKSFGRNRECTLCKMLYVVGDVEDENRHTKNCKGVIDGLLLQSLKGLMPIKSDNEHGGRSKCDIFEVRNATGKILPESVQLVMNTVQVELGISADDKSTGTGAIYLCTINGKSVVACLVVEETHRGIFVPLSASVTATEATVKKNRGSDDCAKIPRHCDYGESAEYDRDSCAGNQENEPLITNTQENDFRGHGHCKDRTVHHSDGNDRILKMAPAASICSSNSSENKTTLGVRQMWVHRSHRRRGFMSALLDAARKHFLFGTIVMKRDVGYSQPTDEGLRFALGYGKTESVWGYV